MGIEQWWTELQPSTRKWLINNNGDEVQAAVVAEIAEAGGPASDDSWWSGQDESPGHYLPDDAIDWVEATANGEEPG
ncbi:hypothetical protein ACFVGV_16530 [Pseudarthrobacter scleromae]|uniref:hypothetical protein n=1 Tax=Pseudarthrobacter scleromae TaxID=158897 RepID=UPI0036422B7E